jgi:hypothetical protein
MWSLYTWKVLKCRARENGGGQLDRSCEKILQRVIDEIHILNK